jgi:dGTPase
VETLYSYYLDHIDLLPDILKKRIDLGDSRERAVCDHISSMTDRYAVALYENLFIPRNWSVL